MDIHYIHNGSEKVLSVPVTQNAAHEEELMKSDFVRLSFDDAEGIELPLDAYIVPFTDMVRYSLLEPYKPEQRNEEQWHYEPLFQHPKMYLGKVPFVFKTKDSDNNDTTQLEWDYTGYVGTLLERFCEQINAALKLSAAESFTYAIVGKIDDIVSTTFSSMDILSGLSNIAGKLSCEYHLDWELKILYFGHITLNRVGVNKPTLEVGVNVGSPSVRNSKDGFWNAFEPQGSTRNISRKAVTGENVQSTIRLSLRNYLVSGIEKYPDGIIYTDGKGNVITKAQFEQSGVSLHLKSLIFDEVYPKLDLYVYDVRSRERYLLDDDKKKVIDHYENGVPVYKRYSVWYMRLAYPTYNQLGEVTAWTDYTIDPTTQIIDGKSLYGAFQPNTKANAESSPLAGRGSGDDGGYGFALNYHTDNETIPADVDAGDSGVQIKAGDYEIVFQQDGDLIMPTTAAGGIIPKGKSTPSLLGNIVNLYNIVMDSSFTQSAQNELENVAKKEIANYAKDNNSYSVKSYPDAFEGKDENLQDKNPHLFIGQSVTYKNGDYTLETRVMKLVTNLDYDFVQEITVGNEVIKGTTTTLKEQVQSILSGNAGVGGGGVDENLVRRIIKAFGDTRYLSKINDDTAQGLITLIKGLQVGNQFVSGLLGEGGVFRKEADGKTYLEADKLYIRMKAYFDTIEIRDFKHSAGNRVASPAGAKCVRVAWFNSSNEELEQVQENLSSVAYFRCYFRADDGEDTVRNNFVVGDQVYCHITTVNGADDNPSTKGLNQKHYWRLCIGKNTDDNLTEDGEGWVDLSNRSTESIGSNSYTGYQINSDVPEPQDSMVQLGNVNDTTRQGAIIEFVMGADAPSYQIYQGINSFSLTGRNMITLGYNSATGKAELKVYGDAFIGDPNRTTYIEYVQDDGTEAHAPKLKIKAEVEFTNSKQDLDSFVQSHQRNYDDTEVRGLIDGLQDQIDGQVESWFYNYAPVHVDEHGAPDSSVPLNIAPYSDWTTEADKIAHLGDTFTDNSTGYCWRFSRNEDTNAFEWVVIEDSAIISALQKAAKAQETADNKRRVFLVQPTPPYDAGDVWVNAVYPANYTGTTDEANHKYNNDILKCVTAKASGSSFSIDDWKLASKYTDDSKFNGYISALLNNTGLSGDAAAAAAQRAVLSALGVGTVVSGGLLLTSLIGMRQYNGSGDKSDVANYTTWAGISGQYDANVRGGGIAAWYGGGMVDHEVNTTATDFAKSLFRFDGSGYLASGNISWNENGAITIKNITTLSDSNNKNILNELATFNSAFTFGTSGQGSTTALYIKPNVPFETLYIGTSDANKKEVATKEWVNGQYVTKTWFDNLFRLYNGSTKINVNDTIPSSDNLNIEAMFGFWTKKYISALGQGDDGTTSYTTLAQLNDVTLSNPTANQVLTYNGTHWVNSSISLGSQTLAGLSDVTISSPADKQILSYDATTQKWKNIAVPATGVTSVALSMPTGFSITGSPITASGTFAVTFASGYSLPTTAKQSNWDTAYGWGNHASAGYALAANLGTASGHAHSDYLTNLSWDSTNNKLAWAKGGTAQTAITIGYASAAGSVAWGNVSGKPTTLSGYGITDAKIANGVITLGANTITPVTTLYTLSVYGGTTKVLDFKPNANASLYIKASGDISLTNDTTNKYITLSYSHPTNGANTTIAAANGKVLSAITVNSLGHVTSVSAKTLAATDIPDISGTYATAARATTLEGYFTNGVANKAAQLNISRTLWGQPFNGTANVSGNMTNVGNITMAATNGTYIQLGDIRIVYDSANNALKVVKSDGTTAANFYATGGISALGMDDEEAHVIGVLNDLNDVNITNAVANQILVYDGTHWRNQNQQSVYELPVATTTTLGGIKVGTTLAISSGVLNLPTTGVTAGTYRSVGVDAYGRVTGGTNPTTLSGYGITDAKIANGVITLGANTITPLTSHQTLYTLSVYGGTTKVLDFKPNANASLYIKTGGDISLTNDTTNKYITLSYSHPTNGANTTIAAANGKVLSAITVNNLGHVTSVSSKTLAAADIPDLGGTYLKLSGGTMSNTNLVTNLNADLLDGVHASTFMRKYTAANEVDANTLVDAGSYRLMALGSNFPVTNPNYGQLLVVRGSSDTIAQMYFTYDATRMYVRTGNAVDNANGSWKDWKTVAFTDSNISGNAGSATKLQTARTINGTSFDGSANITTANWGTARNISIADSDSTNNGSAVSVNGSAAVTLKLPSTIKATLSGNASTATKLQTSRTLWGQSFNGTANVDGTMTLNCADWENDYGIHINEGGDTAYGFDILYGKSDLFKIARRDGSTTATNVITIARGGGVSILDRTSITGSLSANGSITTAGNIATSSNDGAYVQIGGARIVWDNTNSALKVVKSDGTTAANFYATGGVSALGMSEDGSAGSGDVTWALLASSSDTRQIAHSHLTTALASYALKTDIPTLATLSWSGYSSGSYNGSEAKTISIPNNTNQLTNGAGYITLASVKGNLSVWNNSAMGWGTLTEANGYTIGVHASSSDGGDWGMTYKGGKIFMQLDGFYYQNEGNYRVLDTSDIGSNVASQSTLANYLPLTGGTISNPNFGAHLTIERSGSTLGSAIAFKNSNGILGYIGMANTANGGLQRWNTDTNISYLILDSGNSSKVMNIVRGAYQYTSSSPLTHTNSSKDGYFYWNTMNFDCVAGQKYIISCETDGTWSNHDTSGKDPSLKLCSLWITGTDYNYCCGTNMPCVWTCPTTGTYRFRTNTYSNGTDNLTVHFWNFKVERGQFATDWNISVTDPWVSALKATSDSDGNAINSTYLKKSGGTMTGGLILSNNVHIYAKDTNNAGRGLLGMDTNNCVVIATGAAGAGYNTFLDGNNVYFRYSTSIVTGMVLNSSGNVGIGTTSPSYKLHVNGTINGTTIYQNGTTLDNTYLKLSGGTLSGKLNIGSVTTSHATKLEVRTANTTANSIEWGVAIKNPYNDASNYNLGAGIRICLGADTETTKFGGIAYIGTATYFNSGKLAFYASGAERAYLTSENLYIGSNAVCHAGNSSVSKSGETLTVKINGTSQSLTNTNTTYSAGKGLRLSGTQFISDAPRVTKDSKAFGGANTWIMEEYNQGTAYNLPSNHWYHIMSTQGTDTAYGTQLALGMTTAAAYYRVYNNGSWGNWQSIINTWRGIQNNLTSDSTTDSLSAAQGKALANGSARDNTKLPLAGGTMTGNLKIATGLGISDASDNGLLVYHPADWTGVSSSQWGVGAAVCEGVIRSSASALKHYRYNDGTYDIIDSKGGQTINSSLQIGSSNGAYLQIGAIRLVYDSSNNAVKVIKSDGGNANFYATGGVSALGAGTESGGGGDVTWALLASGSDDRQIASSHLTGAMAGFTMSHAFSFSTTGNVPDALVVNATDANRTSILLARSNGYSWSMYAYDDGFRWWSQKSGVVPYIDNSGAFNGYGFNNLSDIRKKNVVKDVDLRLDQIAKAPAFEYYWLDTSLDHDLHVGTSAQYWQSVLPQVVTTAKDDMGTLSMQYGVAALISTITVARKVMTHEEKIALLETRVSALEKENGEQEQLIKSLQEELAKFKAA